MDTGKQLSARFAKVEHRIIISLVAGFLSLFASASIRPTPFICPLISFVALLFGVAGFFELVWLLFRARPVPSVPRITLEVTVSIAAIPICLLSVFLSASSWQFDARQMMSAKIHRARVVLHIVKAKLVEVPSPQRAEKVRSLKLPEDPFARPSPIHYRINSDGSITLWSIGPDKTDQFAQQVIHYSSNGAVSAGDIVTTVSETDSPL